MSTDENPQGVSARLSSSAPAGTVSDVGRVTTADDLTRATVVAGLSAAGASAPGPLPTVSIVIPCKNSAQTIRATVEALLGQDYPALAEVILVGDIDDPTWTSLTGIADPRLVILEQGPTPGRRDPNVKRHRGIGAASGEVLALVDSDIVMGRSWLSKAVSLLLVQGSGLVAGGMCSIHDTFWGRFVDNNRLAAKTPRLSRPYQVTTENFGRRGCKPPITANAVFTRALYEQCALDECWVFGYEDYEWFWRLAKAQHAILFSDDLTAAHHHRRSFWGLVREYRQAADGCAHYMRVHPDSPLARKRLLQLFLLPTMAVLGFAGLAIAVLSGYSAAVAALLAAAAVLVTIREVIRARSAEAILYPVIGLALGFVFTASMLNTWIRLAWRGDGSRSPSPGLPYRKAQLGGYWPDSTDIADLRAASPGPP
jgi:cellulose synthase/poly-beta-1,6-N-acetylglucosamine synthase-like glycosyltransferase